MWGHAATPASPQQVCSRLQRAAMLSPPHGGMAPGCGTPQSEAQAGALHQQSGAKTELKKPLSLPPGQHSRHSQPHVQTQQQLQDAEDVHAIVRKLMKAYAPELIASFEDFVSQSYRENAQVHTQELTDRIFRRDGHAKL